MNENFFIYFLDVKKKDEGKTQDQSEKPPNEGKWRLIKSAEFLQGEGL